jgi:malonyl CoA-acyl carrier protein transacylase
MVEHARAAGETADSGRGVALLLLTAPDRQALLEQVDALLADPTAPLPVSGAAQPDAARLAIAAPPEELRARLTLARSRLAALARPRLTIRNSGVYLGLDAAPPTPRRIAFLFPGQGSQHVGMLHELYRRTPTVRGWLDALDAAYASVGRPRPSELIYGEEAQEAAAPAAALFSMEQGAQLSTVANLALYELMGQLGIHGDALVGHSIGEHAAVLAAHAGHAAHRAAICAELCQLGRLSVGLEEPAIPEAMAAVSAFDRASLEALVARNPQQLFIAMDNCPHQQVLAGTRGAVDAALAAIVAAGGIGARLPFVRAYHTPLFGPRAEQLAAWYRRTGLTPAPLHGFAPPVYSCLTGQPIPTAPADAARVMAQQWVAPVNFRSTVERLYAAGIDAFVEVGPDAKLTAFVEDILRGRPHLAVSMLGPAQATPRDLAQIGHMLAALFAHGAAVDTARYGAVCAGEIGRLGDWEIRRLEIGRLEIGDWRLANLQSPISQSLNPSIPSSAPLTVHRDLIDAAHAQLATTAAQMARRMGRAPAAPTPTAPTPAAPTPTAPTPAVGRPLPDAQAVAPVRLDATRRLSLAGEPFLADHSLGRGVLPVLSFTTSLALAAETGSQLLTHTAAPRPALLMTDLRAQQWLAFDGGALTVRIAATRQGNGAHVSLYEDGLPHHAQSNNTRPAFQSTLHLPATLPPIPNALLRADGSARPPARWDAASFYSDYAFHGPSFQGLAEVLSVGTASAEARVRVTDLPGRGALPLDPALLDCAGQLVAFWLLEAQARTPTFGIFPVSARRFVQQRPAPPPGALLRCRCRVVLETGGLTRADVAFFAADGQPVAFFEDFVQRLIEFPPALAACLFGGKTVDFSQPLPAPQGQTQQQITVADWTLLWEGQGVWARLLAAQALTAAERDAWRALPAADAAPWLLRRIVAKETVRAWAVRYLDQAPPLAEIEIAPLAGAPGETNVQGALAARLRLHLTEAAGQITARVERID